MTIPPGIPLDIFYKSYFCFTLHIAGDLEQENDVEVPIVFNLITQDSFDTQSRRTQVTVIVFDDDDYGKTIFCYVVKYCICVYVFGPKNIVKALIILYSVFDVYPVRACAAMVK